MFKSFALWGIFVLAVGQPQLPQRSFSNLNPQQCQILANYFQSLNLTLEDVLNSHDDDDMTQRPVAQPVLQSPEALANSPPRRWMTLLPQEIKNRPLTHLAIPGSHDSFTYDLDTSPMAEFAPDNENIDWANNGFVKVLSLITGTRAAALAIVKRWSKTQDLSFEDQLNAGIRYFDARVAWEERSRSLRFVHGLWGPGVFSTLETLKTFLDQNPGEVVFLHFNRFYGVPIEQHRSLAGYIRNRFGGKLVSAREWSDTPNQLTLAKLQEKRQQLIVLYEEPGGWAQTDGLFWKSWIYVQSPWPETTKKTELVDFLQRHFNWRTPAQSGTWHVYQGVFTPNKDYIGKRVGIVGGLKELSLKATQAVTEWLPQARRSPGAQPGKLNICMADFADRYDFPAQIVGMNF